MCVNSTLSTAGAHVEPRRIVHQGRAFLSLLPFRVTLLPPSLKSPACVCLFVRRESWQPSSSFSVVVRVAVAKRSESLQIHITQIQLNTPHTHTHAHIIERQIKKEPRVSHEPQQGTRISGHKAMTTFLVTSLGCSCRTAGAQTETRDKATSVEREGGKEERKEREEITKQRCVAEIQRNGRRVGASAHIQCVFSVVSPRLCPLLRNSPRLPLSPFSTSTASADGVSYTAAELFQSRRSTHSWLSSGHTRLVLSHFSMQWV
jgi:hypothetical protein